MLDAISGMEIEQQQLKQHTEKLPISRCRFLSVDTAINFNPTPRVVCKAVFDAKTPSNSLQQRSVYLPIRYIIYLRISGRRGGTLFTLLGVSDIRFVLNR